MKYEISLVISVYDAAQYLKYVLFALERQTFTDFEVIIAADGSPLEMEKMVSNFQKRVGFPIQYVWHLREGFRKTVILNKAIQKAIGWYLIFIDGDCLPHRKFVEDHWQEKKPGVCLAGRRVMFGEKISRNLTVEDIKNGEYERINFSKIFNYLKRETIHLEKGLRITHPFLKRLLNWRPFPLLGSNFSLMKENMLKINGFNEDYCGPGIGEDVDIEFRLSLVDVKVKPLKNLGIQYHLYHPPTRPELSNFEVFEQVKAGKKAFCRNGIFK